MLLELRGLLNSAQLQKIDQTIAEAGFVDGRASAGMAAARVKYNEELKASPEQMQRLYRILMSAVAHDETFRSAALPAKVADFIFSRYQPGMTYGDHVDDPIMGSSGPRFRSDLSMTVFLNAPQDYDGGELTIRTSYGDKQVKLDAGDAVLYPSASLHHVAGVTRGERRVALTWIQSLVRDAAQRELLFELDQARNALLRAEPDAEHAKRVDRSYANLLRMWAEL